MIRTTLKPRSKSENGGSEIITTLMILPLILWLIFSLIDVSVYLTARSSVQNAARDAARQVSVWGGNNSRLNPLGVTVATATFNQLYNNGKCTPGACTRPPVVSCTPEVTNRPGDSVQCSITYYYRSIYAGNPITGFASFLNHSFTVVETARAETGLS